MRRGGGGGVGGAGARSGFRCHRAHGDPSGADRGVAVDRAPAGQAIEGAYIVTLKPGNTQASAVARGASVRPTHTYGTAVQGFAAELSPRQLRGLRHNPNVAR